MLPKPKFINFQFKFLKFLEKTNVLFIQSLINIQSMNLHQLIFKAVKTHQRNAL